MARRVGGTSSRPPQVMRPCDGATRPIAARNSVVFPEPFGPTNMVGGPETSVRVSSIQDRHRPGCDGDVFEPNRQFG